MSQPTLSSQIKKLEDELGCDAAGAHQQARGHDAGGQPDPAHAKRALAEAATDGGGGAGGSRSAGGSVEAGRDSDVAPYLMPLILKPLKQGYPGLTIELWEDQTRALVEGLRNHKLDAALLATETDAPEITEIELVRRAAAGRAASESPAGRVRRRWMKRR